MQAEDIQKIFPALSGELALVLAKQGIRSQLSAGAVVYEQGFPCEKVPFILSGVVRVYKLGESGREITLFRVGAGESCILSTSCGVSGASYPAIAEVEEDVDMLALPVAVFREQLKATPAIQNFLCHLLSQRLADMMMVVEEVAFRRVDIRLAERLTRDTENKTPPVLEATHAQLAVDLGTAREVISRILKDFERAGYLALKRGRIEILDGEALAHYRV